MFKRFSVPVLIAGTLTFNAGFAADVPAGLSAALERLMPGLVPDAVVPSQIPGLYQITVGPSVAYLSEDGRYLLRGDLIDMQARKNLTRAVRQAATTKSINALGEDSMIVFGPSDAAHTVTIFTDVDCGYCRRLHQEMDDYVDMGIRVRYTAFPRSGIPSGGYDKMVSVWCADDPKVAMTKAKSGRRVDSKNCDNPVSAHYRLAEVLGVDGTPTIFTETGRRLPGYVPAKRLLTILEQDKSG